MELLFIVCLFLYGFSKTLGSNINGMDKRIYHCPDDFIRIGNSCYFLSKYMDTWHGAQFICKDKKSKLATPNKKWKDRKLKKLLNNNMAASLERWIGGIWNWEEELWVWGHSGRRLNYQGFSRTNSNDNNYWHCIAMDPTLRYQWKSDSCLLRKHFICEVPLRNIGKKPNDIIKKKRRKQQSERHKQQQKNNKESNYII